MDAFTIILRLFITFALSLAFGLERKSSHKAVGFGTFIFVSVGSCAFAVMATSLDTLGLLGSVLTGVGFLGAGALIRTPDRAFGFTTAASIWAIAIFGLVIGVGEYLTAIVIYILIIFVIVLDKNIERIIKDANRKKVTVVTNRLVAETDIVSLFGAKKHIPVDVNINKKNKQITASYLVFGTKESISSIHDKLLKQKWIDSIRVE